MSHILPEKEEYEIELVAFCFFFNYGKLYPCLKPNPLQKFLTSDGLCFPQHTVPLQALPVLTVKGQKHPINTNNFGTYCAMANILSLLLITVKRNSQKCTIKSQSVQILTLNPKIN